MKELDGNGRIICYWSNLKEHPHCIHGPALLFGKETQDKEKKFYACSAYRDRKSCPLYLEYGTQQSVDQKQRITKEKKIYISKYKHQKLYIKWNELFAEDSKKRAYCHTCEELVKMEQVAPRHSEHKVTEDLSDHLMKNPTKFLKPLDDSKKEAQFLFSQKAVTDIIQILKDLGAVNVLCIGTPRIHEYISENLSDKISSLLLDFDGRFHNFFGPLSFCWYNLFNHFFFKENSKNVFEEFLQQNKGKKTFLICDPPFGGRVEAMSQTIKTISDLHKKLNNIVNDEDEMKIFFVFPYFMEGILREKANPPNCEKGLKHLKMTDYKVEYENHPLFTISDKNKASQIRIFTNVSLNLIHLPKSSGYKYCKVCDKWVAKENMHCKFCNSCTSKNGTSYVHCPTCSRCVKPTWKHCNTCERCQLPNHTCGKRPNIGKCFACNELGHTKAECPKDKPEQQSGKRKKRDERKKNSAKKRKE